MINKIILFLDFLWRLFISFWQQVAEMVLFVIIILILIVIFGCIYELTLALVKRFSEYRKRKNDRKKKNKEN